MIAPLRFFGQINFNRSNRYGSIFLWGVQVHYTIYHLKEVVENHQKFDSWKNALKADGYDTIPISTGIITAGMLSRFSPGIGFIGGVWGGIGSNIYSNQKKRN